MATVTLLLLLGGGVLIPTDRLPAGWSTVAGAFPSGALADGLRAILVTGAPLPLTALLTLLAWAIVGAAIAARTFRWE